MSRMPDEVRQALETRRRLEESGVRLEQLQKQHQLARQHRAALPPETVNIKPLLEALELLRRPVPPEWLQVKKDLDELLRTFASRVVEIRNAVSQTAAPVARFLVEWQQANRRLDELVRNSPSDHPLALLARHSIGVYETNAGRVARRIEERELMKTAPAFGARLALPAIGYADFSRRTIERIGATSDPEERSALGGSLVVAQEHVSGSTGLIEEVTSDSATIAPAESPAPDVLSPESTYNLYDAAQQDLLVSHGAIHAGADYPALSRLSTAAVIAEQTRSLVRAVIRCNQNSLLRGGENIFKLTNTFVDACVMLPGLSVRDDNDLRNFIFYLYMVFYEGAGKDNLRYIERGLVTGGDCGVIWTLKGLRNKWHEHDREHGDEGKIRANYRKLGEALDDLGLTRFPREAREYEDLQRKLIERLAALVAVIEKGLS